MPALTSVVTERPEAAAAAAARWAAAARTCSRVETLGPNRQAAGVRARERQQVVREPREPLGLVSDRLERLPQLISVVLAPKRHLHLGEQHRQRRAELVARLREQPPLPRQRLVQAPQQRVQRVAERLDLVVRRRHRQPLGGVALGDLLGTRAHALDRAERGARDLVAGVRGEDQGERADDEEQLGEPVERLVAPVERLGHGHGERLAEGVRRVRADRGGARRDLHPREPQPAARGAASLPGGQKPGLRESGSRRHEPAARVVDLSQALLAARERGAGPPAGHERGRVRRAAAQVRAREVVEIAPELREQHEPADRQHRRQHARERDREAQADRQPAEGKPHGAGATRTLRGAPWWGAARASRAWSGAPHVGRSG